MLVMKSMFLTLEKNSPGKQMKKNKRLSHKLSSLAWHSLILAGSLMLCPVLATTAQAMVEFSSSPNPVGSGARALGMGGAFIAVADDATAASWNPGGLIQLEFPEISYVGAYFKHMEANTFTDNPEATSDQSVSRNTLNYLSAAYPFEVLGHNMIVSLNYQNLFDFSRDWQFPYSFTIGSLAIDSQVDYDQNGQLYAYGLAYSIQITPEVSFGLTWNLWEDGLKNNMWQQNTGTFGTGTIAGIIPVSYRETNSETFSFSGTNFNLGLLWNITGDLTIGAVLKTPFKADLRHTKDSNTVITRTDTDTVISTSQVNTDLDEHLDMPTSYGIGFAYRFSDNLTTSLDFYRTEWDEFIHEDSTGTRTSFITGEAESVADIDSTTQVRMGAEYLIIKPKYIVPLRGGLFYDPAPASGGPDEYYGVTLGSGVAWGKIVFDVAYQYRWGDGVGASLVRAAEFTQDVEEHTLYTSFIFHF